ncbi:MAG: NAD(P)/FAD-dependent oxidoreductase [Desulfovermiculus sp.]
MKNFDVFVIGTGTAGETAVSELLKKGNGLRIGIADERPYGGTCALRGCQPKKYLIVPAHAAMEGQALTERGFRFAPQLDWKSMHRSLRDFTDPVPQNTKAGLEEKGIDCLTGHCTFLSPDTLLCGDQRISAKSFIVATGARPRPLSIKGAEMAVSSDGFLSLEKLLDRVVFIGGGYITMEFSYAASAAGASVTVLQRGERIMKQFDPDMVTILEDSCSIRGIDIRTGVNPLEIRKMKSGHYQVLLEDGQAVEGDLIVGAIGRVPNVDDLGLEEAGVAYERRGIQTDAHMRTSQDHIYAVGDCVKGEQLSPVSDLQARTAARNILVPGSEIADISTLPSVVFSYPQLAMVGIDEQAAKEREGIRIAQGSGAGWPNYLRLNESHVGYKVIIDKTTETVLGAHLVGPHAGELINLFALAMKYQIPSKALQELPWAYPTYSADIKYMLG